MKRRKGFVADGALAVFGIILAALQGAGCANSPHLIGATHEPADRVTLLGGREISFYRVPLVCPAAPGIGCGSAAKPLLLDLESSGVVSEAWLNRAGTTLGLVWSESSTPAQRSKTIKAGLKKQDLTGKEISVHERRLALKDFESRKGWYRGAEVDRLSEEEAGIIAARWVERVREKISLTEQQFKALHAGFTRAIHRKLIGQANRNETEQEMLKVCRAHLGESEVALLQAAFRNELEGETNGESR